MEHYLSIVPPAKRMPAHDGGLGQQRDKLPQGVWKTESSLATQLRTETIGFAAFFHIRRVPGLISPACQCGRRRQDLRHVIIFCPNQAFKRRRLYEKTETQRYQETLSTEKCLRAIARWVMKEGLLGQFWLAREQMALVARDRHSRESA